MSGAWVVLFLIVVMVGFLFTVQSISRGKDHPILTQKDVNEALKKQKEIEKEE